MNIRNLNREEYRTACKHIPKDHDTVLRAIAEYGEQDLKTMHLTYIFTESDQKQKYINDLKDLLAKIQDGTLELIEEDT